MEKSQDILALLKAALPELRKEFGVKTLGVFGSVAHGTAKPDSDLDLLVEFDQPLGLRFMEFSEKLEHLAHRPVDILTPIGLDNVRQPEIAQSIRDNLVYV